MADIDFLDTMPEDEEMEVQRDSEGKFYDEDLKVWMWSRSPEGFDYDEEQLDTIRSVVRFALAKYNPNEPVVQILEGKAGTGKSTIIREVVRVLGNYVRLCATTGRAAVNIGGVTIDRIMCFSRTDWEVWGPDYLDRLMTRDFNQVKLFICDEGSMVGYRMASVILRVLNQYHKKLLLVGDWCQAAPVKDEFIFGHPLLTGVKTLTLSKCHRQNDMEFISYLNEVRAGRVSEEAGNYFARLIRPVSDKDVVLYATNNKTERYNMLKLDEHCMLDFVDKVALGGTLTDCRSPEKKEKKPLVGDYRLKIIRDFPAAEPDDKFAIGCRILITANNTAASDAVEVQSEVYAGVRYVNGDTGVLKAFVTRDRQDVQELPDKLFGLRILLDRTGEEELVAFRLFEAKNEKGVVEFTYRGIPVALAYAMTIHKAQGATIPQVWVNTESLWDFPTDESRHGLLYVALSRVRTVDTLGVSSWNSALAYNCFTENAERAKEKVEAYVETPTSASGVSENTRVSDVPAVAFPQAVGTVQAYRGSSMFGAS